MRNTYILGVLSFFLTLTIVACKIDESRNYGLGVLRYCNPKYFSYCSVTTAKKVIDGVDRFFITHEFRSTVTLGNNITAAGVFYSRKGTQFKVEHKLCDYFKQRFIQTSMKTYHLTIPCPIQPRTLIMKDLEIPFPNTPIPMVPGTYEFMTELYTTVTKERILGINYTLHFASKSRNKNKKG